MQCYGCTTADKSNPYFSCKLRYREEMGGGSEESPERDMQAKHVGLNSVELTWTEPIDCAVLCLVLRQRY